MTPSHSKPVYVFVACGDKRLGSSMFLAFSSSERGTGEKHYLLSRPGGAAVPEPGIDSVISDLGIYIGDADTVFLIATGHDDCHARGTHDDLLENAVEIRRAFLDKVISITFGWFHRKSDTEWEFELETDLPSGAGCSV